MATSIVIILWKEDTSKMIEFYRFYVAQKYKNTQNELDDNSNSGLSAKNDQ